MSVLFQIALALFFFAVEGAGVALLVLMIVWPLAVRGYRRLGAHGTLYFSGLGALGMLLLGSAASSLAPKPLFIEDQTFFEGFKIAIERQGLAFSLIGLCFGLTFWLAAKRRDSA